MIIFVAWILLIAWYFVAVDTFATEKSLSFLKASIELTGIFYAVRAVALGVLVFLWFRFMNILKKNDSE